MLWGVVIWASLLTAVGSGTPAAASQAPVARARLELGATTAAGCASAADLSARIAARAPRIQIVNDAAAIGVRASFAPARSGGVSAELVLVESGVSRPPRRFVARSCAEAVDALALMVAVALDPVWVSEHGASGAGGADIAASAGSTSPAGEGASKPATLPVPAAPTVPLRLEQPRGTAEPPVAETVAESQTDASGTGHSHLGFHLAGQGLWGPAPAFMPGIAVYAMGALDRDGLVSPALVLGAFYAWRSKLDEPGGRASFSLLAGSVDACVLRLRVARADARLCGAMIVGGLSATGSDTEDGRSVTKPFVVAGAISVVTVPLGPVELAARFGAGMTWPRSSYEFGSTTFYTSWRLTISASLGLGVAFW